MSDDEPDRETLLRVPFEYQDEAIDFLCANPNAGLFLDMGLGKTMITLHGILEMPRPVLLVGPIRVIETVWEKEASEWMATRNLTFSLLRGSPAQRKAAAEAKADIYMVNPEMLEEALDLRDDWKVLVVDESTLFKNPSSKRFKKLRYRLKYFERRIILTGTPAPNSLMDLWSQVFILDRGERLDTSHSRFKQEYFHQTDWQGYKFAPNKGSKKKITKKISDIIFRLARSKPLEQPIENTIEIHLPKKARKLYEQMEKEAFMELAGEELTAATAATKLTKLRQIAGGFIYDEDGESHEVHREKIEATAQVLDQTGSPVILVYQYKHELEALKKAFPQGRMFDGDAQKPWDKGKIPLLFLHPQSGGHGLNLQKGGHVMLIYSGSFSLEQMMQIRGRIDRTGQKHTPIFHTLLAVDTVDELLVQVLEDKAKTQSDVLKLVKRYAERKHDVKLGKDGRRGKKRNRKGKRKK